MAKPSKKTSDGSKAEQFLDDKYATLDAKTKLLIGIAFCACLPLASWYFVIDKDLKTIEVAKTKQTELSKEIQSAQKQAARIDQHRSELEELRKLFTKASILLPEGQEIPNILSRITSLGTNSNLRFLSFDPAAKETTEAYYNTLPITIEVAGTYHDIGGFLSELSKFERMVSVAKVDIEAASAKSRSRASSVEALGLEKMLHATITLEIFRFTNTPPVGTDA